MPRVYHGARAAVSISEGYLTGGLPVASAIASASSISAEAAANSPACTWIVVGGASGDPASPHYTDQHEAWSRCALIPMLYDWDVIAATSPQLTLQPDGSTSTGAEPA